MGNRSKIICLNSLNIKTKIWLRSLKNILGSKKFCVNWQEVELFFTQYRGHVKVFCGVFEFPAKYIVYHASISHPV